MADKITTIKLSKETKERLDHFRVYKRETYEEIIQKMLDLLNTCRTSPGLARMKLVRLERHKKEAK